MAIKIYGRTYNNRDEQIEKNKDDISELVEAGANLKLKAGKGIRLDKDTKYIIITATGDTEAISDVKVNGSSVVTDGVANITLGSMAFQSTDRYYTVNQVNNLIVNKVDRSELSNYYTISQTNSLLGGKVDVSQLEYYYTKSTIDSLLSGKVNTSQLTNYYTKVNVDSLLDGKADVSTTYTKTETDNLLNDKADKSTTYTKTEVDSALALKQDISTLKATILDMFFPIGTIYSTVDDNFNPNTSFGGTWTLLSKDQVLWSVGSDATGGTSFSEQLPNITGSINLYSGSSGIAGGSVGGGSGALSKTTKSSNSSYTGFTSHSSAPAGIKFDASDSNSIYTNNGKVRPAGTGTHFWKRTA